MFLRIVREYLQDIYPEFWEQYSQFQLDRFISVKLKFSNNLVAFVFLVISVLHVLRLANKSYFKIFNKREITFNVPYLWVYWWK